MTTEKDANNIISDFNTQFGFPEIVVQSPARINIIGEHTDYNGGLALPFAANKYIWFCARKNGSEKFNIYASDVNEKCVLGINDRESKTNSFGRYFHSAIQTCKKHKLKINGLDIVFGGNIPIGAGLSSSSSLTCGFFYLLNQLFQLFLSQEELINYASESENNTGIEGGRMDQTTIIKGTKGNALLLDFYFNEQTPIPLNMNGHSFVLFHSNTQHNLVETEYNSRRSECNSLLKTINKSLKTKKSIRQLDASILSHVKTVNPELSIDKLSFVLQENERVLAAVEIIKQKKISALGNILYQSHQGLSQLYEVSCPELDFIVYGTKEIANVLGARIMGGGFGGCALAIIRGKLEEVDFLLLQNQYAQKFNKELDIIPVETSDGVKIL